MSSKQPSQATLRMYCQGLGDCHLLKFSKQDGRDFWMLIDCGIHTSIEHGRDTIDRIVADISQLTQRLDVVVATHEHWDHLSGFLTAKEQFEQLSIGEIWMAWTEHPKDVQAKALDKFKDQALTALGMANNCLENTSAQNPNALDAHLQAVQCGLKQLLGFHFGVQGERVREARNALVSLAPHKVKYLQPADPPLTLPGLPNLRIYVLGPPRSEKLLGMRTDASEMYGLESASGWSLAAALNGACQARSGAVSCDDPTSEDGTAPFDSSVGTDLSSVLSAIPGGLPRGKHDAEATADVMALGTPYDTNAPDRNITNFIRKYYVGQSARPMSSNPTHQNAAAMQDQSWRRIDHDWLGASTDLALQLDSRTNNTSLVLAFELIDTGRVLLFAADAQAGSWLSWQEARWKVGKQTVTGPQLLARTVFYKVGHHGSHNATLKRKGLELMQSEDLSAFIPTNAKDAMKVGWSEMPFRKICTELKQRTAGRVVRADDAWVATSRRAPPFQTPSGSIRGVRHEPGLWVELDVG